MNCNRVYRQETRCGAVVGAIAQHQSKYSKPMWKAITGTYHLHEVTGLGTVALLLRFPLGKELPTEEQIFATSQLQHPLYYCGFSGFAISLSLPIPATLCRRLAGRIGLVPVPVNPEKCSRKNLTGFNKKNHF